MGNSEFARPIANEKQLTWRRKKMKKVSMNFIKKTKL